MLCPSSLKRINHLTSCGGNSLYLFFHICSLVYYASGLLDSQWLDWLIKLRLVLYPLLLGWIVTSRWLYVLNFKPVYRPEKPFIKIWLFPADSTYVYCVTGNREGIFLKFSVLFRSVSGGHPPVSYPEVHDRLCLPDGTPDPGGGCFPHWILQGSTRVLCLHSKDGQVLSGKPGLPLGCAGHLWPYDPEELFQGWPDVLHASRGPARALQLPQPHPARALPRARTRAFPRPRPRPPQAWLPVLRPVRRPSPEDI